MFWNKTKIQYFTMSRSEGDIVLSFRNTYWSKYCRKFLKIVGY